MNTIVKNILHELNDLGPWLLMLAATLYFGLLIIYYTRGPFW